jgi:hypothetical protein
LESAINNGLTQIGEAIDEFIQLVEEGFDALKLETAIAGSQAAMNLLYSYRDLGLQDALVEADGYSSNSVGLLLQQDKVFFIGGVIAAGNVRIDVIRALDAEFATDEYRIQEITALADCLEGMISKIEQRVRSYSDVIEWENIRSFELPPGVEEPGVSLPPTVTITQEMSYRRRGQVIASFPFSCGGMGCTLLTIYSREEATRLAEEARERGIAEELASLGVPEMREILDIWRNLVVHQQTGYALWRLLGRRVTSSDWQRAARQYFNIDRIPVLQSEESTEAMGKQQLSMELRVNARPFIVDILTSQQLKKKALTKLDRNGVYDELFKRIFNRTPGDDEKALLRQIEDVLGFDGLIAGIVYGKEYTDRFGAGVPTIKLPR